MVVPSSIIISLLSALSKNMSPSITVFNALEIRQLGVGEDQNPILRLGFSCTGTFIHLIPCHYRFIYFTSIDLFLILFPLTMYERIPLGKTISCIFVCFFFLSSVLPCTLYSQCCKGEESTLTFPPALVSWTGTLTGNSEAEDDCKGDCSPVMHCGDCLTWFITTEILKPSKSSDQKTF